jgi:hypothetical protein
MEQMAFDTALEPIESTVLAFGVIAFSVFVGSVSNPESLPIFDFVFIPDSFSPPLQ